MNESLISVIVPVYNSEMYLAACLDSIISQTYRNLEIIVINDGSTDFSLEIAQTYADKDDRIKVFSQDNAGLSEARNRGLSVATGDLITFVDSDDLLLPDAMEILNGVMLQTEADIVEGGIISGDTIPKKIKKSSQKIDLFIPEEAISRVLYQKILLPSAWGKLYKSALFENIKYSKGILYEDLDIFYKIYDRSARIAYIDYPVYFYRNSDGSIVNSWKPQRLDVLDVTDKIEKYISEKYPDLLPAAKDRRLSANFNMFALCSIHGDKNNAGKCWQHIKQNRLQSLLNPKVRSKNKAGILLSYCGKNVFNLVARRIYR